MPKERAHSQYIRGILDGFKTFTGPGWAVIDLTNRCNNDCIACWTRSPLLKDKKADRNWRSQKFPYPVMRRILTELHKMGTNTIYFSGGGDPMMHPHLLDIVEYVKSLGMMCGVTTNGTLLDRSNVNRFIDVGLDNLAVSLWAGDPVTYAKTHPNKSEKTFYQISEALFELRDKKKILPYLNISNVLCNINYRNALQIFEFARNVRANAVYFTLVDPIPGYTDCLLLNDDQKRELIDIINEIERLAANLTEDTQIELRGFDQFKRRLSNQDAQKGQYDSNIIDAMPCYVGWTFCRLLPDGSVSPCCRGVNKPMGNLFQHSFREIWESPTYCEFRYNALHLKKRHPYFRSIDCYTTCDNLGENLDMHRRILEIFPENEKHLTRMAG